MIFQSQVALGDPNGDTTGEVVFFGGDPGGDLGGVVGAVTGRSDASSPVKAG